MSFTLPANSHCPSSSAPSLPWRSRIPHFSSAAAVPGKAPFTLTACHYPTLRSEPLAARHMSAAIGEGEVVAGSPVLGDSAAASVVTSDLSSTDTKMASPATVAVGMGAAAAGAVVSAGGGAIADSPTSSKPPVSDIPNADTSTVKTPTGAKAPSSTPIPPHLLSPIPPSRPSVPESLIGERDSSHATTGDESSDSVETPYSAPAIGTTGNDIAGDDDFALDIEGGYLDGAEELASVTSFGNVEPLPVDSDPADPPEPDSEAVFLDALESTPVVVSMGEVVDESVLAWSADATSSSAGIVGDAAPPSLAGASAVADGDPEADALPDRGMVAGQPKQAGGEFGKFIGGFIAGFAIVALLIFLGVRILRGTGPSDSTPPPESTTETE